MAYTLHVKQIERAYLADVQTAHLINAMGGKAETPDLSERLREFDEWLNAEPKHVDSDDVEWREAMGLGAA